MRIIFGALLSLGLLAGFSAGQVKRPKDVPPRGGNKEMPGVKGKQDDKNTERVEGKTLAEWIKELKHPDASRRSLAILAIIQFKDASAAVPHIVYLLRDRGDVSPRAKACVALRTIGVLGKDVDAAVIGLARRLYPGYESQAIIRYEAAVTLQRFAEDAGPAIPALAGYGPDGGLVHSGVLDLASWEIRHVCVGLLWRAGRDGEKSPDPTAVKGLLRALGNTKETYDVRVAILQGLAMMGRPDDQKLADWVISDLTRVSASENKVYALWALAGIVTKYPDGQDSERALIKLAKFTTSHEPTTKRARPLELRSQAAHALGALGKRAKSQVPLLLELLKDKEPLLVKGSCLALSHIGDTSDKVVDGLIAAVKHKDHNCAVWAIRSLLELKVKHKDFKSALEAIHKDGTLNENLRSWAKFGLDEIGKPEKRDLAKPR